MTTLIETLIGNIVNSVKGLRQRHDRVENVGVRVAP